MSKNVSAETKVATKFETFGSRLMIKRHTVEDAEEKTNGGIIIPKSSQDTPNTAVVYAVGPEVKHVEIDDVIVVGLYTGTDVVVGGESFTIIDADDALGRYR